jgi:hypothetical protein
MPRPNNNLNQVRNAERFFPVRIRVARGRLGRDRQYYDMCQWLDEQIGVVNWFHVEEHLPALIDRFSLAVWINGEWPHGGDARTHKSDMGWVGDLHRTR